jgi:hypothetical protein
MGIISDIRQKIVDTVAGFITGNSAYHDYAEDLAKRREYYYGYQRPQLATKPGKPNFNVTANFTKLVVDRSVSLLFGKGVEYIYPEGAEAQQEYIDQVYEDNKGGIFYNTLAQLGAQSGHCYVKIAPQAEGTIRLIAQDPMFVEVTTDPNDKELVLEYVIQYKTMDMTGHEVSLREVHSLGNFVQQTDGDGNTQVMPSETDGTPQNWNVARYHAGYTTGGRWVLDSSEIWPYPFAAIVDWQNLINTTDHLGMPDITDDVIGFQDSINFIVSNTKKIVALAGHPIRWGRDTGGQELAFDPDKFISLGPTGELNQLVPPDVVTSFQAFSSWLRQALMDITQTVDIASMADRVGALTNFGLRVLYNDALGKLEVKRQLYGWGLREVNRRVLSIVGLEPVECKLDWPDPLPEDAAAEATLITQDLNNGIVSKQTASEARGYTWEDEQQRMADEKTAQAEAGGNIGAFLLNTFNQGR